MAKEPDILTVDSGFNSAQSINESLENLKAAFRNTISRNGETPNTMEADLDMNSNDLNNVGNLNASTMTLGGSTVAISDLAGLVAQASMFLSPASSNPTTRDDGTTLEEGDIYFNTVDDDVRVWTGASWISLNAVTVTVDRFSGDSAETDFTLTTDPESENNTQVFISGVYQQKDTYSVSGTTLTFSTAPPTGTDNIEVVTSVSSYLNDSIYVSALANRTTLKAANTSSMWFMDGSWWKYDSSMLEAKHLADVQEGILVSPTGSGDGAWVRQYDDGVLNVRWFGARGDDSTICDPLVQDAIDLATAYPEFGTEINYPKIYDTSTASNQFYRHTGSMSFEADFVAITGSPAKTQLKFVDCNGFVITNTNADGLNKYNAVSGLRFKGTADGSSSSTQTNALDIRACTDCIFENLQIDEFVIPIDFDVDPSGTSSKGGSGNVFRDIDVSSPGWVNPTNLYPLYGFRQKNSDGSSAQFANNTFINCRWQAQNSKTAPSAISAGASQTSFTPFTSSTFSGLTRQEGIKVWTKDTNGHWTKATFSDSPSGAGEYALYDYTGGSRGDQILAAMDARDSGNPMPNNNGEDIEQVEVVFAVAPGNAVSSNVKVVHVDPWGEIGMKFSDALGNRHIGGKIGGYRIGVETDDNENTFDFDYLEIIDVSYSPTSVSSPFYGTFTTAQMGEEDVEVMTDKNVTWLTLDNIGPSRPVFAKRTADLTLTGSYANVLSWDDDEADGDISGEDVPNFRQGTHRKLECTLHFSADDSGADRVTFDGLIQVSYDQGGNWSTLRSFEVDRDYGGATDNFNEDMIHLEVFDNQSVINDFVRKGILYRVQARSVNGTSIVMDGSASSKYCSGFVTIINP